MGISFDTSDTSAPSVRITYSTFSKLITFTDTLLELDNDDDDKARKENPLEYFNTISIDGGEIPYS